MCCIEGGICIVSVDFMAVNTANTMQQIGALPNGIKPLGCASAEQLGVSDDTAYIAPLRYRGNDGMFGQMLVTKAGAIYAYVNNAGRNLSYYYGQLVFPVTRS